MSSLPAPSPPTPPGRSQLGEMITLAAPLVAGHAGTQLMSLVDTAMVGRLGPAALGGVAVGNGIFFAVTILGLGCVLGMDPLVTQAKGAGEEARARRIYWSGLRVALYIGLPLTAIIAALPALLDWFRVERETAAQARDFVWGRLPNVIPLLLFAAGRSYAQAVGATRSIMIAVLAANVANFVGNALLIYGDGALAWLGLPGIGLPALGVFGSGLSSSIASALSFVVIVLAVRQVPAPPDPARRALDRELVARIFRLGTPVGLQLLAEVAAFATAGVLAGTIGATAAAGYQIAISLASFTFTVTIGIAAATSVLVGRAVGRGDTPGARRAGILGFKVAALFMACAATAFVAAPWPLARMLTNKPDVLAAGVPLIMIAAVFQISDGLQAVGAGALRGAGDTRTALFANLVGYYLLGLPLAVALAFGARLGAPGLWWGLSAGLTFIAAWLVLRFLRLSSRPIARV